MLYYIIWLPFKKTYKITQKKVGKKFDAYYTIQLVSLIARNFNMKKFKSMNYTQELCNSSQNASIITNYPRILDILI